MIPLNTVGTFDYGTLYGDGVTSPGGNNKEEEMMRSGDREIRYCLGSLRFFRFERLVIGRVDAELDSEFVRLGPL